MVSEDFKRLTDLIFNKNYKIYSYDVELNAIPDKPGYCTSSTTVTLKRNNKKINFNSNESDVTMYILSWKDTVDKDGNVDLMCYKDLDKFYEDIDFLIDTDNKKIQKAIKRLITKDFKFEYDQKNLLEEFLNSDRKTSIKFEKLKENYFEISAHYHLGRNQFIKLQKEIMSRNQKIKEYCELINEILNKAFNTEDNPIKNYLKFINYIKIDMDDLIYRAKDQSDYIKDIFGMLGKRGKVEGEIGIRYLLDIYRRVSELLSHYINALRISIEIIDGNKNPELYLKYAENCDIIKRNKKYAILVKCLDPRIRHSESHINTEIDKSSQKVILTENKKGKRVKIDEYTFNDISEMTKELERMLSLAILVSFYLFMISLIVDILDSKEYLILLLGIGNRK